MNGTKIFVDTNILLYLLSGDITISEFLQDKQIYISFITQLELLSYKPLSKEENKIIRSLMDDFVIIDINNSIKDKVVHLRRQHSLKLPDAIISATAIYLHIPLITADSDFKKISELDLIFYKI